MRKLLPLLVPIVLIAVAAFIVALGRGYRVDVDQGTLTPTGILLATSDPDGAQVFVDGKFSGATNSNISLKPGWYDVAIHKEGYQEWKKRMRLQGEVVAKTDGTLFLTNPSLSPLISVNVTEPFVSPDGTKIAYMATPSMELRNGQPIVGKAATTPILYILDLTSRTLPFDKNPKPYEGTKQELLAEWEADQKLLTQTAQRKLPLAFAETASASGRIISFSPDMTKVLYEATAAALLPRVIDPPFIGTSPTEDVRNLKSGVIYVYDVKEDRNYAIPNVKVPEPTPTPTPRIASKATKTAQEPALNTIKLPLQWLGTSKHLVLIEDGSRVSHKISIMEYDGTNKVTVYSGPFEDNFVFAHPNGRQVMILTTLNPEANPTYSLYTLNLR